MQQRLPLLMPLAIFFALSAVFSVPYAATAQTPTITGHWEQNWCWKYMQSNIVLSNNDGQVLVRTDFGDGTIPTTGAAYPSNTWAIPHWYESPGTYTIKHVLLHYGSPVDSIQFSYYKDFCNYIPVRLYNDANNNCVKDPGESYIWTPVYVEIDSAGVKKDTITISGSGTAALFPDTAVYTLKLLSTPPGTGAVCPTNGTITATLPGGMTAVEFGIQCTTNPPLDLAIADMRSFFRPVATSWIRVLPASYSCNNQNATLTVSFSSKYNFSSAQPTPASVSGNTVTWNISALNSQVGLGDFHTIFLTPAGTVNLGDTVCVTAQITPITGDVAPANNTLSYCDSVRAAYDPNSKEAIPAPGKILANQKLTYTINFENLGNDTAFNIHILDTLSDKVNVNSFEMLGSSHMASLMLLPGPNGSAILKFELADIKLADKNHPESNKGFVRYSISPKPGLSQGTIIENRAGIYFDINPVVMTNSTIHTIDYGLNVADVTNKGTISIYPNPANNAVVVTADPARYSSLKIVNGMGQAVASAEVLDVETHVRMEHLPAGIYYILVTGRQGTVAEKLEKR